MSPTALSAEERLDLEDALRRWESSDDGKLSGRVAAVVRKLLAAADAHTVELACARTNIAGRDMLLAEKEAELARLLEAAETYCREEESTRRRLGVSNRIIAKISPASESAYQNLRTVLRGGAGEIEGEEGKSGLCRSMDVSSPSSKPAPTLCPKCDEGCPICGVENACACSGTTAWWSDVHRVERHAAGRRR